MKKTTFAHFFRSALMLLGVFSFLTFVSCKEDDEPVPDPIASFQYEISTANFLQVTFTSFSQNADTYLWAFGDGNTATEENPTHTYAQAGAYTVKLTATNKDGVNHEFEQSVTITDPNEALKLLTGEVSKTWKLFREGVSMSAGPNPDAPAGWWPGLENKGERPCLYKQEFTFHLDGKYVFNDNGLFWGEYGVFNGKPYYEKCFEATVANMKNRNDDDVSAWLSGTHAFTYDASAGKITLTGNGAWIGVPKLGTTGETLVPVASVTFNVEITQETGYDLMTVTFDYGDGNAGGGGFWTIVYVSYSNPALEPAVEEEPIAWGEDLDDITPTEMFVTFAARDAANMATIDTVASISSVVFGVDDPTDPAAAKVGRFIRTAGEQWQELKFRVSPDPKDIQFDNFTTAKIDIYIPADTDFTTLKRHFVFGFADVSATQQWWNSPVQFVKEDDDVVLGAWTTYTFDLASVKERKDLDMIYLGIGGGGHVAEGIFYVRNLKFE
jgi:PKD repeat protein